MIELLFDGAIGTRGRHLGRTLEVGTGCGYQTALLAQLARRVVSIERLRPLFDKAVVNLAPLRLDHVRLVHGDGMLGHGPNAPYDSLIAAAGGDDMPAGLAGPAGRRRATGGADARRRRARPGAGGGRPPAEGLVRRA